MKAIIAENPTLGRTGLARLAGVTEYTARVFLDRTEKIEVPVAAALSSKQKLAMNIADKLSDKELNTFHDSVCTANPKVAPISSPITGHFKALVFSDTHIGHSKFNDGWYYQMLEHAVKEGCDWAWHPGDILEGMSGRPGHVYELDCIGFEAQFAKAVRLFDECPFPIRAITGNHDSWYTGKGDLGINVGERLQAALPDKFIYLGVDEADEVVNGITVKLWHGGDGSSYATSYRTQKFVEQLTGGDKPHILLSGHAHKSLAHVCRNVFILECGTLCSQTGFMRGKKLAAHIGYWILEVWTDEQGLRRVRPEWCPFYL